MICGMKCSLIVSASQVHIRGSESEGRGTAEMPHNNIAGNLGQTLAADRPIGGSGPWSGICVQAPHTCPRRAASIVEAVPPSYTCTYSPWR